MTNLLFHIISARPSTIETASYGTYLPKGIWSSASIFVSARTNKRNHHQCVSRGVCGGDLAET
jgi:hypothetical protein